MDPLTISAILSAGPSLVRAAGKLFGGRTESIADSIADTVDAVRGQPNAEQQLEERLSLLTGEDLVALQQLTVEVERIRADTLKAELQHEASLNAQLHQTRRAEIASDDSFVRRTRPQMARDSMKAGVAYVLLFEAGHAVGLSLGANIPRADIYLAGLLFTPLLEYIGVRTIDKVKGKETGTPSPVMAFTEKLLPRRAKA